MSLLSDIKFFLKKFLKNPVLVSAIAYIIYKLLKKYIKKESFAESIKIIEETPEYSLIFDDKIRKYILIADKVYSSNDLDEIKAFAKKFLK